MTIFYFIIAIGILILIHELGHFIVAIRNNIRVETFSIGFGPKLLSFKRGETEYKIAPIPLGGYVKMTGEDPDDAAGAEDERSFARKSVWTRMKVVGAGPLMNIIFAFVMMPVVFLVGRMEPKYLQEPPVLVGVKLNSPAALSGLEKGDLIKSINGKQVATWDDVQKTIVINTGQKLTIDLNRAGLSIEKTVTVEKLPELKVGYIGVEPLFFLGNEAKIDQVTANGPAAAAGIQAGDKVVELNGATVEGWIEMAEKVNAANGKKVKVAVERAGEILNFDVEPTYNKDFKRWVMGIVKGTKSADMPMVKRQYGLVDSVKNGFKECASLIGLTFEVLKKLVTLQLSYKSLGGPVQIAQASATAAEYGLGGFLYFLVFLSVQLGVLNLLPIPILDGGQIVFCAIEGVIRRPVPARVRAVAQYAGLAFLLSMMLLVTVNDIDSIWGIKKLLGKIF